jgi:plasmid replication initiation protein
VEENPQKVEENPQKVEENPQKVEENPQKVEENPQKVEACLDFFLFSYYGGVDIFTFSPLMRAITVSKIQEKNIVSQANSLIEARYSVSKNEQKLLSSMISLIEPTDKEFLVFSVTVNELSKILNLDPKSATRQFKRLSYKMMQKVVEIKTPTGWKLFQWVIYSELKDNTVYLQFHDRLKPYLLELKKSGNFTQFRLGLAIGFKSAYTVRIYQLLKEYHSKRIYEFEFSLEDFRKMMLGNNFDKYKLLKDFKKHILTKTQKELSELNEDLSTEKEKIYKSDLNFDLTTRRTGRKISHLIFSIKQQQTKPSKAIDVTSEDAEKLPPIIFEYHQIGLTTEQVKPYLDERGEEALKNTLNKIRSDYETGKVKSNLAGYAFKLLRENAGQKTPEEIAEEKRKEAQRLKKIEAQRQQIKKELITTLADEFGRIERERFITSLSEKESKRIFSEITAEYEKSMVLPLIEKDGLASNIIALKLQDFIPQFKENKEKYISEKLKESGLL